MEKTIKTIKKIGKKIQKAAEKARKNLYYEIEVYCKNCKQISKVRIIKGITVRDGLNEVSCNNCGCRGFLELKR